jgi:hypothetical protein
MKSKNYLTTHWKKLATHKCVATSDRPKFGSVPADIFTGTKILVSVPAKFELSVPAEISVQILPKKLTKLTFFAFLCDTEYKTC